MKRYLKRIISQNTTLEKIARSVAPKTSDYVQWMTQIEPILMRDPPIEQEISEGPTFSIIVPCYNTPDKYLLPLLESVTSQTYPKWQLCIADGSTDESRRCRIKKMVENDERIIYVDVKENLGIVGNTNIALNRATGDYVVFLDHDDLLAPAALSEIARVLVWDPSLDLVYSDEDKISDDGMIRQTPFFKPDWSPELLLGVNYITHIVAARRSIVDEIGGLRDGFDGAQDYDFLLRFTEKTQRIGHIPKILYHWRLADGSTAKSGGEKNYADTAGRRALADAVKRRGIKADVVEIPERPTNYRLRYYLPTKQPLVSIVIPFKDKADLLKQCVGSILKLSTYANYEIILVSNNSTESETHQYLDTIKSNSRCKVYYWDYPFNYSAVNNYGVKQSKGEYLILLNNDTKVITPSWIEELIGVAAQPDIGAVGALLYYPNNTIQHAGIVMGMTGMAGHPFRQLTPNDWTPFGMAAWPRNYIAVTGACLAVSRHKYLKVGGLDETFTIAGNDVALGISLVEAGYRNVFWPFAELNHYESVSVGSYNTGIKLDFTHSMRYYRPYIAQGDRYFNSNLDLMNEQIGVKTMKSLSQRVVNVYKTHGARGIAIKSKNFIYTKASKMKRKLPYTAKISQEQHEEYSFVSNPIFLINSEDIKKSKEVTRRKLGKIKTANWFVPNFDHINFGGIFTIFRFIEKLSIEGVNNRIIIYDYPGFDVDRLKDDIAERFPRLRDYEVIIYDNAVQTLEELPACDIAFCTFWISAYLLLKFNKTKRKYYFIQDYEPLFYAGGSTYALAESTYRFGLKGVVNTPGLLAAVNQRHGMEGVSFIPAVDQTLYRPLTHKRKDGKVKVFFYARPNNPRNAFNLCIGIIRILLDTYGGKVEIITAGAKWDEAAYGLGGRIRNLGLLQSLDEVADLYRNCDIGVVYMLSKHPSYQPFEFMASGMATVTNNNEDNLWLLKDGVNCLLSEPSPAAMAEAVGRLIEDEGLREAIAKRGLEALSYTWTQQLETIWNEIKNN